MHIVVNGFFLQKLITHLDELLRTNRILVWNGDDFSDLVQIVRVFSHDYAASIKYAKHNLKSSKF